MTFKEIQDLIKLVNKTDLAEFKMKEGEFEISIRTDKYSKTRYTNPASSYIPMQSPIATATPAPLPISASTASPAPATNADEEAGTSNYLEIKSPIVGTFYRAASPEKPPYVSVGDTVSEGSVVCVVEAMKLFNEIESEISGKIVKVMIDDAQPVEYDQVLFLVDPNG